MAPLKLFISVAFNRSSPPPTYNLKFVTKSLAKKKKKVDRDFVLMCQI